MLRFAISSSSLFTLLVMGCMPDRMNQTPSPPIARTTSAPLKSTPIPDPPVVQNRGPSFDDEEKERLIPPPPPLPGLKRTPATPTSDSVIVVSSLDEPKAEPKKIVLAQQPADESLEAMRKIYQLAADRLSDVWKQQLLPTPVGLPAGNHGRPSARMLPAGRRCVACTGADNWDGAAGWHCTIAATDVISARVLPTVSLNADCPVR